MRRSLILAATALALLGGTNMASAYDSAICYQELCVCVSSTGCYRPPSGEKCISIDIDDDGHAERICTGSIGN